MSTQLTLFESTVTLGDDECKHCPQCDETKPISYFYRHSRNPDGYGYLCANCENPDRKSEGPVRRAHHPPPRTILSTAPQKSSRSQCLDSQEMIAKVVERDIFCRVCGSHSLLEVHRISFAAKHKDNLNYLTCLCPTCHKKIHAEKGRRKKATAQTLDSVQS